MVQTIASAYTDRAYKTPHRRLALSCGLAWLWLPSHAGRCLEVPQCALQAGWGLAITLVATAATAVFKVS